MCTQDLLLKLRILMSTNYQKVLRQLLISHKIDLCRSIVISKLLVVHSSRRFENGGLRFCKNEIMLPLNNCRLQSLIQLGIFLKKTRYKPFGGKQVAVLFIFSFRHYNFLFLLKSQKSCPLSHSVIFSI